LESAATLPAISANRMIVIVPRTTTHATPILNREPVAADATKSPMSTNAPIAVRIPSVISKIRFT
jgi:hypothetical protein